MSAARLVHQLQYHAPISISKLLNDLLIKESFHTTDTQCDYFFEFTTSYRCSPKVTVKQETFEDYEYDATIPDMVSVSMETLNSSEDELNHDDTDPLDAAGVALLSPQSQSVSDVIFADGALPFKFIPGVRMGSILLYSINERQLYRLKNTFKNCKRYACIERTCHATLYLKGHELSKAMKFQDHNHPEQETDFTKRRNDVRLRRLNQRQVKANLEENMYENSSSDGFFRRL